ncbi:MAG: hypothetical protein ACI4J1_12645 [Ruminiclostridium sp.]
MPIAKWDWTTANPAEYILPAYPYVIFDATEEQVKRAYATLESKGFVREFSTSVWNDLCAKIRDINLEWRTGKYFDKTWPSVWIPSSNLADYPSYSEYLKYKNLAGVLRADAMNMAVDALYTYAERPWKKHLGRTALKKGDEVKAEYFFWLVDAINHWCELSPAPFAFSDTFVFETVKDVLQLYDALPLFFISMDMEYGGNAKLLLYDPFPFSFTTGFSHKTKKAVIVKLPSAPLGSKINFMTITMLCSANADNFALGISGAHRYLLNMIMNVRCRKACLCSVFAEFIYTSSVSVIAAKDISPLYIRLAVITDADIHLRLDSVIYFRFSDSSKYIGSGKITTKRPIPLTALTKYTFDSAAAIEFEGIELLDMADGLIRLFDRMDGSVYKAATVEHNSAIFVKDTNHNISVPSGEVCEVSHETLTVIDVPSETVIAPSVVAEQIDTEICITEDMQITSCIPTIIAYNGVLENLTGTSDLTFANEIPVTLQKNSIRVHHYDADISLDGANDILHTGEILTSDEISLQETNIAELTAAATTEVIYEGSLAKDSIAETAGSVNVGTQSSAEITCGLNALLEADIIAAKTVSAAETVIMRIAALLADSTISTAERGNLAAIIRSALESDPVIRTTEYGRLLVRLTKYAESDTAVKSGVNAKLSYTNPDYISGSAEISPLADVFLDKNYVGGNGCVTDSKVSADIDAALSISANSAPVESAYFIRIMYDALVNRIPAKQLDGDAISSANSEAHIITARVELILASIYEDVLAAETDDTFADDVERHLIYQ